MALERKLLTISSIALTSDGTNLGLITIADTINFKDKQIVYLQSFTVPVAQYQIKRVISETQFIVGPVNNKISPTDFSDVSAYKTVDSAQIGAVEQDKLAQPTDKDHYFAIYESSPVNADRVIFVDPYGKFYDTDNPLPASFSGTISVGSVDLLDPTIQQIQNIPLALANTEYTISLPSNTKRYQLRVRDHLAKGRLAFLSGETATNYWTITRGTVVDSENMDFPASSVIYVSVSKPTMVVELRTWIKP